VVLAVAAIAVMAFPVWGQTSYPNRAIANDTVEPRALSPEATAKHVAGEITRWKAAAQRTGVRLD
jgi:hypothetical protein